MFNLQGSEIVMILLLALVVLGPEKLPQAIRRFSTTYQELKKMGSGFQSELKSALDEPMREMQETADVVREAADPKKLMDQFAGGESPDPADDLPLRAEAAAAAPVEFNDDVTIDPDDPALDPGTPVVGRPPEPRSTEQAADAESQAPEPSNRIAAANSSAAIASRAAASDADEADEPDEPEEAVSSNGSTP